MTPEMHPDRLYVVNEVADFLRLSPKSVYAIPRSQLAVEKVGATGGGVRYWGRDVLAYLAGRRRAA